MMDYYWLFGCLLCFAWGVFVTYMRLQEKFKQERLNVALMHCHEVARLERALQDEIKQTTEASRRNCNTPSGQF